MRVLDAEAILFMIVAWQLGGLAMHSQLGLLGSGKIAEIARREARGPWLEHYLVYRSVVLAILGLLSGIGINLFRFQLSKIGLIAIAPLWILAFSAWIWLVLKANEETTKHPSGR